MVISDLRWHKGKMAFWGLEQGEGKCEYLLQYRKRDACTGEDEARRFDQVEQASRTLISCAKRGDTTMYVICKKINYSLYLALSE